MTMEDKTILTESELTEALQSLSGWEYLSETHEIQRVWQFEKFVPTMAFVRQVTETMDANNHHSDIHLDSRRKTLTIKVTTHSENAITRADIDFAQALNRIG